MRKWLLLLLLAGCATPTVEQKFDFMVRPVVKISMTSGGYGSGVVYSSNEEYTLIITVNHVTRNEDSLWVELNGVVYDAELIKESPEFDLSILRIEATTDFVAHIHDEVELQVFDEIITVGAGRNDDPYPAVGIVSNVHYDMGKAEEGFQYSAATVKGGSGGGIFRLHDNHYELVGITSMIGLQNVQISPYQGIRVPVNNIGFAIPMHLVRDFIKEVS